MLQLLKRFEEESVEELDDDEEDSEMARRLASVDLGAPPSPIVPLAASLRLF